MKKLKRNKKSCQINKITMKKQKITKGLIVFILLLLYYLINQYSKTPVATIPETFTTDNKQIVTAYKQKRNDIQVTGEGTIVKLLSDDLQGSRHQRFLVKVNAQQTLLISHNIDLAPRINSLQAGEKIKFHGEYVWNKKGGIIHWTHHDPGGRHQDGWLRYKNKLYQ